MERQHPLNPIFQLIRPMFVTRYFRLYSTISKRHCVGAYSIRICESRLALSCSFGYVSAKNEQHEEQGMHRLRKAAKASMSLLTTSGANGGKVRFTKTKLTYQERQYDPQKRLKFHVITNAQTYFGLILKGNSATPCTRLRLAKRSWTINTSFFPFAWGQTAIVTMRHEFSLVN